MKKIISLFAILFFVQNLAQGAFYTAKISAGTPKSTKEQKYIKAGEIYVEEYKLDAAKEQFLKALNLAPKSSCAHNGLGLVYYYKTTSSDYNIIKEHQNMLELAQKEFETAISLNPQNASAHNNLGRILQEKGNLEEAHKSYQKAIEINPNYADAICNLGYLDFLQNKTPEAIEKYKKSIKLNSKNPKPYIYLAQAYSTQEKYSEALKELNTSVALFSNNATAQILLGQIYNKQGNEPAAINAFKKAILIKPENIEPYLSIADIHQNRGDNDLAIAELKNALSINPNHKESYLKLADMLLLENKSKEAANYYKKVIKDAVYSSYALKGLANAYFNTAKDLATSSFVTAYDYEEAKEAIIQAISANPNDLPLYLALLKVSAKNPEIQQLYLNKILNKSDYSPISSLMRGEAYLLCNDYKNSQKEFETAIDGVKNYKDCVYMGEIFIINRQYNHAMSAFYKGLELKPEGKRAKLGLYIVARNKKVADSYYKIAQDFYKEKQKTATIEQLKKAIALNPQEEKYQILMAKCYEKMNKPSLALEHYQMCVNLIGESDKNYKKYTKKCAKLQKKLAKNNFTTEKK